MDTTLQKLALVTSLATSLAIAGSAAADPGPAAKPAPTDPKLAQLVGRWDGGGTFTLKGKTIKYKSTLHCERAILGPAITCAFSSTGDGGIHYDEFHLIGYDKATDSYHLFSVNDWGEAFDHAAKWTDAAKVSWQYDVMRDGKPSREIYSYELRGDTLVMHNTFTTDGKPVADGTGTLKRVP